LQEKEDLLKSIRFWRAEVQSLSLTERIFFRDAIRTLQTWTAVQREYEELDLIKRVLESELVLYPSGPRLEAPGEQSLVAAVPAQGRHGQG
jgi:hypothetical protein